MGQVIEFLGLLAFSVVAAGVAGLLVAFCWPVQVTPAEPCEPADMRKRVPLMLPAPRDMADSEGVDRG